MFIVKPILSTNTAIKFKATIIAVLWILTVHSQTVLNLRITDLRNKPLATAIIKYRGSVATSNASGFLQIGNYQAGSKLEIHKFGFEDTTITLGTNQLTQDTINLTVALRLKITLLSEVTVNASQVEEINPLRSDFIIGYELKGNYLMELLSNDMVLVMDADNVLRSRTKPISGIKDIVKNPDGSVDITTEKRAYSIHPDSANIRELNFESLLWDLQYCDEITKTSRFIRRYTNNNQTVAFFAVSKQNSRQTKLLKEITDAERSDAVQAYANETNGLLAYLKSLEDKNPAGVMGDLKYEELELYRKSERMALTLEKNYALPSYSVLKLINDSIYLFAHDIDSMFVYDLKWNQVKAKRITYHHLKIWGKELIVNEERTKVYAKLVRDSKPMIAEVDLQTGTLKSPSIPIEFRFPKKIRIRNNVIYFMAKQQGGVGYTIYAQRF